MGRVCVRGDEWGVSYDVCYRPMGVTLRVYKSLPLPNKWGGIGVGASHPIHDGKAFASVSEAEAYALAVGLTHVYTGPVAG
jgi:hypothetical protein